jgi:hypothetical protein
VAVQSNAWNCGRSVSGIVGANPAGACKSLVSVVCCEIEVSVSD